jgi:hypothetical protein
MSRVHRLTPATRHFLFSIVVLLFALVLGLGGFADAADNDKAPTVVKELVEKRTVNSKTYLLTNGDQRCELYTVPVNYRDGTGAWQTIDTTLAAGDAKGTLSPKGTPAKVTFSAPSGAEYIASVTYQGATVSISAPNGLNLAAPVAIGNKALYPAPGKPVTVTYEVQADGGVKETITLTDKSAPSTFMYTISHPGLLLSQHRETGEWGFYQNIEGRPIMTLGGLEVSDSSLNAMNSPTYCTGATMKVTPGKDQSTITITVPQSWLSDPTRKYPVMVDPDVSTVSQWPAFDTWVGSAAPYTAHSTSTEMYAYSSSNPTYGKARSLLYFEIPAEVFQGWVKSSTLNLWVSWTSGTQYAIRAAAMTKEWASSSTWSSLGSDYGLDYAVQGNNPGANNFAQIDVKNIVQHWADYSVANYGFCVYGEVEEPGASHMFRTRDSGESTRPYLTIVYKPRVNIAYYGANGADQNDDTQGFEEAIADSNGDGADIYVPAGVYYLSGLDIGKSNVTIEGEGSETLIIPTSSAQSYLFKIGSTSSDVTGITLKNLRLQVPSGGDAVLLDAGDDRGGSDINLEGLVLLGGDNSDTRYGINNLDDERFTDINVTDCYLRGITAEPVKLDYVLEESDHEDYRFVSALTVSGSPVPSRSYSTAQYRGSDAADTSVRLAQSWRGTVDGVVLTPDNSNYAAALVAGPLAKVYGGPVLCSPTGTLAAAVGVELQRLKPTNVFVVGFDANSAIAGEVRHYLPTTVITVVTGSDGPTLAVEVAKKVKSRLGAAPAKVMLVAFDDLEGKASGLSASALASANCWPILLASASGNTLPTVTRDAIDSSKSASVYLGTNKVVEVGVSDGMSYPAGATVVSIPEGDDRNATAQATGIPCLHLRRRVAPSSTSTPQAWLPCTSGEHKWSGSRRKARTVARPGSLWTM